MSIAHIDTNGKLTIPPEICDQLGLQPGTEIQLEVVGDTLHIRKPSPSNRGQHLIAAMRGTATSQLTTQDIMQLTREDS